jgi:hypothetical protein
LRSDPISLSDAEKKVQRLNRKISRGIPLDEAAVQLGIPIEEVFSHVSAKLSEIDTLNFELRLAGQGAIKKALRKLSKLASGDQRVSGTLFLGADGKSRESQNLVSDDLEAAKALAKFGIDALKLARSGKIARDTGDAADEDLFDRSTNPWDLKKIE